MTGRPARRGDEPGRVAQRPLSVFTRALAARVLRAHLGGGLDSRELEEAIGWAPESTVRAAVGSLCDLGALTRHGGSGRSRSARTALTTAGRELLPVAGALERWFREAPQGPVALEDDAARGILRLFIAAWDSAAIRALAAKPLSPSELAYRIAAASESTVRGRLPKLRAVGLVGSVGSGRAVTYAVTDWLRRAVVPLALAGHWELRHGLDPAPIAPMEAETVLMLALPLVDLSPRASGHCTLAFLTPEHTTGTAKKASVAIEVARGEIVACEMAAAGDPSTWALGTTKAWLEAVIEGEIGDLRIGGSRPDLALHVVRSIGRSLRCR